MAEYIEREAALDVCEMHYQHCLMMHDYSGDTTADQIKTDIEAIPAADVVEVVRCKDCKHKGWIQEPCHGKSIDFCRVWDTPINRPDKCFCYYGERKDDRK